MKKILAILLSAVLLVSVLCVGTVAMTIRADAASVVSTGQSGDAPAIALDSVSACAGDTVTVALRVQNNPGIVALRVNVTYDPAVLTPVEMVEQDFAGASFGPLTTNPLTIIWVDAIHPDVTDDGVVALLTFTVAADAPAGESALLVGFTDPDDVLNAALETVTFDTVDGSITVMEYTPGDMNGNGRITMVDMALLQRWLYGWDVTFNESAADVNGDGKINIRDLGLLQQYLNGWDVTLVPGGSAVGGSTTPPAEPTNPTTSTTTKPTTTITTTVAPSQQVNVKLPAIGTDIDVINQKNRIRVSAASAYITEDDTIAVSLTFQNYATNWITEEADYVMYTYYDADGKSLGTGTIYIGCIDTQKNKVKTFTFEVPAAAAEVALTSSKITYWTEWA